jgi:predicted nucleic acid-binding protein
MGWVDALRGNVIGLDTTPLIYFTEENPTYLEAEEAAHLRAFNNIRTPDSIQMATAINEGATIFLTNDLRLPSLPKLRVLALDTLKAQSEPAQSNEG